MQTVSLKTLRAGQTVWILTQFTDGRIGVVKRLLATNADIKQAKHILCQFSRPPMWYSRRKAISTAKLAVPLGIDTSSHR